MVAETDLALMYKSTLLNADPERFDLNSAEGICVAIKYGFGEHVEPGEILAISKNINDFLEVPTVKKF